MLSSYKILAIKSLAKRLVIWLQNGFEQQAPGQGQGVGVSANGAFEVNFYFFRNFLLAPCKNLIHYANV
jgi:hypothetical protein